MSVNRIIEGTRNRLQISLNIANNNGCELATRLIINDGDLSYVVNGKIEDSIAVFDIPTKLRFINLKVTISLEVITSGMGTNIIYFPYQEEISILRSNNVSVDNVKRITEFQDTIPSVKVEKNHITVQNEQVNEDTIENTEVTDKKPINEDVQNISKGESILNRFKNGEDVDSIVGGIINSPPISNGGPIMPEDVGRPRNPVNMGVSNPNVKKDEYDSRLLALAAEKASGLIQDNNMKVGEELNMFSSLDVTSLNTLEEGSDLSLMRQYVNVKVPHGGRS